MGGKRKGQTGNAKKAQFKNYDKRGHPSFLDVKSVGWINDPLEVGELRNIIPEKNRFVFEFMLKGKSFNAWSSNNTIGKNNAKQLKTGLAYILKGTMMAKSSQGGNYFRSSNASMNRYSLFLGKIEIVKKEKKRQVETTIANFSHINQKIRSQKSFNEEVKNVKILSGKIYRYVGCENEDCFAKLQTKPGKQGTYCFNNCSNVRSQKGKVRLLLKEVCIENQQKEKIDGITIFHGEIEKFFGQEIANKICRATSDRTAERQLKKHKGNALNARLCHQKPQKSSVPKQLGLILKAINVIVTVARDEDDDGEDGASSSGAAYNTPPRIDASCECENLEEADEVDFNTIKESPLFQINTEASPSYTVDKDLKYILKPHPTTGNVGLAFVVNIKYAGGLSPRNGTENDVETIKKVLPALGIGIFNHVYEEINKNAFSVALKKFKAELIKEKYSCAIVIVMSHGLLYHIRMKDDYINVWKDVLSHFSEEQFPEFCLKPKIFIMQSCQYYNVKDFTRVADFHVEGRRFSDCLWITPCLPGVKAKRNPKNGTYFIQNLMSCLEEFGKSYDLIKILNMLQERMREIRVGEKKEYNIPNYSPMIFNRAFYFFAHRNEIATPVYDVAEGLLG